MKASFIILVVGATLVLAAPVGYAATGRLPEPSPSAKPGTSAKRTNLHVLVEGSTARHDKKHGKARPRPTRPAHDVKPGRTLIWVSSQPLEPMHATASRDCETSDSGCDPVDKATPPATPVEGPPTDPSPDVSGAGDGSSTTTPAVSSTDQPEETGSLADDSLTDVIGSDASWPVDWSWEDEVFLVDDLLDVVRPRDDVLVELGRSGFFFGEHLTVFRSGKVSVSFVHLRGGRSGSRGFTVSHSRLAQLKLALQQARFRSLRSRYAPGLECPDCPSYSVTYAGRTVMTEDSKRRTPGVVPERLNRVLSLLKPLLDSHARPTGTGR